MKYITTHYILIFLVFLLSSCNNTTKKNERNTIKQKNIVVDEESRDTLEFRFEDFLVTKSILKNKQLVLNTNQDEFTNKYKTIIENSYKVSEINFAGNYILAYWGCGTACQIGVVINTNTGNIIRLPIATSGYSYKVESLLLIINSKDSLYRSEFYYLDTINHDFVKL